MGKPSAHEGTCDSPACASQAAGCGWLKGPHAAAAAADPQQVWLIFEPMHYEVLYPAQAYKNLERLSDALEKWHRFDMV